MEKEQRMLVVEDQVFLIKRKQIDINRIESANVRGSNFYIE